LVGLDLRRRDLALGLGRLIVLLALGGLLVLLPLGLDLLGLGFLLFLGLALLGVGRFFLLGLVALVIFLGHSDLRSCGSGPGRRHRRGGLADEAALRSLAGAGVGVGALAPDREPLAVAESAVAAEVHQPLDVHRDLAPQVAFDL